MDLTNLKNSVQKINFSFINLIVNIAIFSTILGATIGTYFFLKEYFYKPFAQTEQIMVLKTMVMPERLQKEKIKKVFNSVKDKEIKTDLGGLKDPLIYK